MPKPTLLQGIVFAALLLVVGVIAWPKPPGEKTEPQQPQSAIECALPGAATGRVAANETAAMATLRNIVSAQAQFQATGVADEDADGEGGYGTFAELSGEVGVRGGSKLSPPVLSRWFRGAVDGRVERSGYYYRIHLPRTADGRIDPERSEREWCAYAWPAARGATGHRTFFVDQWGDLRETGKAADDPAADTATREKWRIVP